MAHVSVPATSANLGAGFDCIGIAVDRRLEAEVVVNEYGSGEVTVTRRGSLADFNESGEKDLINVGFQAAVTAAGQTFTGDAHFTVESNIPLARGLGSSAAAIVAGAFLADEALGLNLHKDALFEVCANIEGHPDNVAPAVYGGAILGVLRPGSSYKTSTLAIDNSLAFTFVIPNFKTETKSARSVLPPVFPFSRAVLAVSRSAALVQGLSSGDGELLSIALDDTLHVPYRKNLIPSYDDVVSAAMNAGAFGATLSGSGSTMVAISHHTRAHDIEECMKAAWAQKGISCDSFISDTHPVLGAALSTERKGQKV